MLSQILSAEARERRKVKSEISGCSCLLGLLFFFPLYIIISSYVCQLLNFPEEFTLGYCLSKRQPILILVYFYI